MVSIDFLYTNESNTQTHSKGGPRADSLIEHQIPYRFQGNGELDFEWLYRKYHRSLHLRILRIVKFKDIADDLLQDAFIKIWKNAHRFDSQKGSLYTWMLNIARNTAIDYMRSPENRFKINNGSVEPYFLELNLPTSKYSIENHIEYNDIKLKALKLNEKYAKVIEMVFFIGWTHEQTAQIMNLPLGTVKTRARKGVQFLKALYNL